MARGGRATAKVANIDLAPTIVAATGAVPGRLMDGRALQPLLADPGQGLDRDLLLEGLEGGGRTYSAIRADLAARLAVLRACAGTGCG